MEITKPEISFINEINRDTKNSLKACMQCGTCSVVCDISPEDRPFPRKEMLMACWGQKEQLMGDADIWLCHQCGDCTTHCPRGVRPGDVLASIRRIAYFNFSTPQLLARILNNPAFLPVVVAIPFIFLLLILFLAGTYKIPEGDINYSNFLPHSYLNISFAVLLILIAAGIIISIKKLWRSLEKHSTSNKETKNLFRASLNVIKEILIHENFKKCTTQKFRYPGHFLIFWGFMLLLITTIGAIINVLFLNYPLSLWHPVKIVGNISGIIFLSGCCIILMERIRFSNQKNIYTYSDWMFLVSVILVALTGFLTEIARFENWTSAYYIYFIHLVLTFILIMYLPYTKFSHVMYRTVALINARYHGRINS